MILYLDTSSLVKLYVTEAHSDAVRVWAEKAEIVATCRVAYPETVSALNRRMKNRDLTHGDYEHIMKVFARDWMHIAVLDFDEREAGRLVQAYGLRGFDAVHLSSALLLKAYESRVSIAFSSFDERLNSAAASERLDVLLP